MFPYISAIKEVFLNLLLAVFPLAAVYRGAPYFLFDGYMNFNKTYQQKQNKPWVNCLQDQVWSWHRQEPELHYWSQLNNTYLRTLSTTPLVWSNPGGVYMYTPRQKLAQINRKKVFQRFELIHRCGQMSNPESFSKSAKTEWANFESCYYLQ